MASSVPTTVRLPFFWGEVIAAASGAPQTQRGLLIGQATTANVGVYRLLSSPDHAAALFGRGSVLHRKAIAAFRAHPGGEWWAIGVADANESTASEWTITFVCTAATEPGRLRFWIGSDKIDLGVTVGDAAADLATRLADDHFPATGDLPVSGADVAGVCTLKFRNAGTVGNCLRVARDESIALPAGVTSVTIAHSVTGAADPSLTTTIAAIAPTRFHKIALQLDSLAEDLAIDLDDRWDWLRHQYGHLFTAVAGTSGQGDTNGYAAMLTAMQSAESPYRHWTSAKLPAACRAPAYEVAAALCGACLKSDEDAPGLRMGGVVLSGCRAAESDDFTGAQKIQLLKYGGTTFSEVGGFLSIDRVQGTCYLAGDGARDERYLDSPKLWLAEWAIGDMHSVMAAEYARMRLVSSTSGRVPDLCATPGMVEGTLRAWYRSLCNRGYAQNADVFDGAVSCTRPEDDRNRLDAGVPANLADNFEIFAPVLSFS